MNRRKDFIGSPKSTMPANAGQQGGRIRLTKKQQEEQMRVAKLASVILISMLVAGGCVNPPEQKTATTETQQGGDRPVRIGFSMDTLKEERWQRDKMLVEQRAKEIGAVLDVQVANGDDAVQTRQADNMLTKGVDVLIVAPHNGEIAASIVEAAHRRGVPVIAYDRLIRNSDVDLYISHQVERMGEMQAEYALKHKPRGNYVLIGGSPTDFNALLLRNGQMKILKPAIDRGDIKIISQQFAKEWRADEALRITEDALTRTGKKIDAIVASNDGTAGGAISALEAAGLAGKVLVTGLDAEQVALERNVRGEQTTTIYTPIQPLAFG